jgi:hypothetical protein
LRTGLYLAQAGEFGFVLLTLGADNGLVAAEWVSPILASMVLSMLATPFLILHSDRIVNRLSASDWLMQSVALTTIARKAIAADKHIIICRTWRVCWCPRTSPTWPWTWTPTASARPPPPGRAWSLATPHGCRA